MQNHLQEVLIPIESKNPLHAKKVRKNAQLFTDQDVKKANLFLNKYIQLLDHKGRDIDYGIECYLKMVADINYEQIQFVRTGQYSSKSFHEVNERVYNNPDVMEYYMFGLLLSQFLWHHHYKMLSFFINTFPEFGNNVRTYLEIGGGHGLYASEAIDMLGDDVCFDVVDISPTAIELSKRFINNPKIRYIQQDIFTFSADQAYDFITMGEILEHLEDPVALLSKAKELLTDRGHIFMTTPTNAPTIDHIYLFRNIREIEDVIGRAGLEVVKFINFYAEDVPKEKAEKLKTTELYGAFLKIKPA